MRAVWNAADVIATCVSDQRELRCERGDSNSHGHSATGT